MTAVVAMVSSEVHRPYFLGLVDTGFKEDNLYAQCVMVNGRRVTHRLSSVFPHARTPGHIFSQPQ